MNQQIDCSSQQGHKAPLDNFSPAWDNISCTSFVLDLDGKLVNLRQFAEPTTANYLLTEGQSVPEGYGTVPRADVAHFMLTSLQIKEWDKKGVAIDAKKKQWIKC